MEAIYVNATSGVQDGVANFLADLSFVKLAVVEAQAKRQDMRRRREERLKSILKPVSEKLEEDLTLISPDVDLLGIWDVQRKSSDGRIESAQWDFIDADTVQVPRPDDGSKSMPQWYLVAAGSVVVSGKPYVAAETKGDSLVLIPTDQPLNFMVATRKNGEP
ncbi:hypothetical protein [Stieleria neptunia]|uniref:hypothetical protein n=1 Tax=Stieleria neptunia TaxID=2527979 RepID=UPI0011A42016|nr:hypothetical protein [Stieleria neptunia]